MSFTNNNHHAEKNLVTFTDWEEFIWQKCSEDLLNYHECEVFMRLIEAGGIIAEDVRRDRYHKTLSNVVKCFIALINVHNRVAKDERFKSLFSPEEFPGLEIFVFERFPNHCPHCGGSHCICSIKYYDSENRTEEEKVKIKKEVKNDIIGFQKKEKPPASVDDFSELFGRVYGQGHKYMTFDVIGFHLVEEIGELATAHRYLINGINEHSAKDLRREYCEEIADIISWIFALWRKAIYQLKHAALDLGQTYVAPEFSDFLKSYYDDDKQDFC